MYTEIWADTKYNHEYLMLARLEQPEASLEIEWDTTTGKIKAIFFTY